MERDVPHARVICQIERIPALDSKPMQFSNHSDSPEFTAIRERVRREATERLTTDPKLRASAVFTSSKSFDRYNCPQSIIDRIGELLGIRKPMGRMQRQEPGVMSVMHMDDLKIGYIDNFEQNPQPHQITEDDRRIFEADPNCLVRFLIPLQDSLPGQGLVFKDTVISRWEAGDVIAFDWTKTPHSTYNTSLWSRDLIRITGFRTQRTTDLLTQAFTQMRF